MKNYFSAFANDMVQRFLSANKRAQRRWLSQILDALDDGDTHTKKALDFGCGTGLFAATFLNHGYDYLGYDINAGAMDYAGLVHKDCCFTTSRQLLLETAPFDMILANCCFHHIDDAALMEELDFMEKILSDSGFFVMIDILKAGPDETYLHRMYMKLEQGKHVRLGNAYEKLVSRTFSIGARRINPARLFSMNWPGFPIGNDLLVLVCTKKNIQSTRAW